ncbi:MAG: hypothetical protein JXR96_10210 [Deltaproteobacteria bacterium]|nr:hypothetical protein [Deltaproteobacteria bacterium]
MLPRLLFFSALALGCSSYEELPGDEIDCAWFEGDNCWRSTLQAAESCLPDSETSGALSSDGKRCTYDSGVEVIFYAPVTLGPDAMVGALWDFEIRTGGDFCLHYRDPAEGAMLVEIAAGSVQIRGEGFTVGITCPDGESYKVDRNLLKTCEAVEKTIPARFPEVDASHALFRLGGTGGFPLELFDCLAD